MKSITAGNQNKTAEICRVDWGFRGFAGAKIGRIRNPTKLPLDCVKANGHINPLGRDVFPFQVVSMEAFRKLGRSNSKLWQSLYHDHSSADRWPLGR